MLISDVESGMQSLKRNPLVWGLVFVAVGIGFFEFFFLRGESLGFERLLPGEPYVFEVTQPDTRYYLSLDSPNKDKYAVKISITGPDGSIVAEKDELIPSNGRALVFKPHLAGLHRLDFEAKYEGQLIASSWKSFDVIIYANDRRVISPLLERF